jgi:hypothetical protein
MSDLHQLLPWYVNGTLDPAERSSFEEHLGGCAACREEITIVEALRDEIRRSGPDLFADHPSPQSIAEALLDGADDPGTRRHLALCATCALEARWLTGETASRTPSHAAKMRPRASRWIPRAAYAAAALLLVALTAFLLRQRPGGPVTGVVHIDTIPSAERRLQPPPVVEVPAGASAVHLLFEVDLGADDFPASFQIVDDAGRAVFRIEKLAPSDLHRGAFLFLDCSRSDCPDGSYVGKVSPAGDRLPDVDYPFRLTTTR